MIAYSSFRLGRVVRLLGISAPLIAGDSGPAGYRSLPVFMEAINELPVAIVGGISNVD